MPECSVEERALLDAVNSGENIVEARKNLFLSRCRGPLFDAAVNTRVAWDMARSEADRAFEACASAKTSVRSGPLEREWLYDEIENVIAQRRAEAKAAQA